MEAFERQECQAAILCEKKQHLIAVLLRSSLCIVFYYTKFTFFKLHGTCCRFSFININASERRNCVYIARLFFLTWMTVKSPCIINVKTSAIFKVGILQCITVLLLFSQIIIRFVVFNLVL